MTQPAMERVVSAPPPQPGVSQQMLVSFGAQLIEAGYPQFTVDRVLGTLQNIVNEAVIRGGADLIGNLITARAVELDTRLRELRARFMMGGILVSRAAVINTINSLLTTPEPMVSHTRLIQPR